MAGGRGGSGGRRGGAAAERTESPWDRAIQAVWKPLDFAARDDFTHADRVVDLEATVAAAAERALSLAIPRDAKAVLRRVAERFAEPLPAKRRARDLSAVHARLAPFAAPGWGERALARSPEALPGVGAKRAEVLARRGLATVTDLLFHLPSRYDDRRVPTRVADLEVGRRATFVARVLASDFSYRRGRRGRGGRAFEAVVGDDSGTVTLRWFRGGDAIAKLARKDALLHVTGDVKRYRFSLELLHPEIEALVEDEPGPGGTSPAIVPDYTAPDGVHPRALRRIVRGAVEEYADLVPGYLPDALLAQRALPTAAEAIAALHDPPADADLDAFRTRTAPAHRRLVLEELYLLELGLALRRARRASEPALALPGDGPRIAAALESLPFTLTGAQRRAWGEIRADLARSQPMNRLLQGDVGCGKTVVALLAAVAAAESGCQTALMAPTELLAEQHARTLARLVEASRDAAAVRLALLTASVPEPDGVRRALAEGAVDLVVGTHALVQGTVAFRRLALVVVDEQHRFGVRQRAALGAKGGEGRVPHTLVMTATPIPRTLSLTLYGDLDVSVIDELPPGRRPARTLLLRAGEGARVAELLRETTHRGEQVYVVYPLVEESEKIDLRAASASTENIRRAFPDLRVDLVHGRLDAASRGEAMERFECGETQVLVSTTVIEVGVDVPNATLMVIEHAERFGLAQLHQLRGRVGRGDRPGTCVCVARGGGEDSEARLRALLATDDGFAIAEADLAIRGPGEFLGTRQHGHLPDLRLADLARDVRLVAEAREAALATVRSDPSLGRSPRLLAAVRDRWGDRLRLADVG